MDNFCWLALQLIDNLRKSKATFIFSTQNSLIKLKQLMLVQLQLQISVGVKLSIKLQLEHLINNQEYISIII